MSSFGAGVTGTHDIFPGKILAVVGTESCVHLLFVVHIPEMDRKCVPVIQTSIPMHTRRCALCTV